MASPFEESREKFIAGLTLIVAVLYLGPLVWGVLMGGITLMEYTQIVGPTAGLLIGYWIKR